MVLQIILTEGLLGVDNLEGFRIIWGWGWCPDIFRARRSKYFPGAARRVALILPWGEITNSFDPAIIPEAVSTEFHFLRRRQKIVLYCQCNDGHLSGKIM